MQNFPKYHISSRIIHWIMALLIISLLAMGIYMDEFIAKDAPYRSTVYNLHKSFGVVVLLLFFVRVINRFINKAPKLPLSLPKWQRITAIIVHCKLYILAFFMPLSGYLMSNSYGYPVKMFGLEMPMLASKNYDNAKFFGSCHEVFAYLFIALISLHILAALKHRFFDKSENDVLKRML